MRSYLRLAIDLFCVGLSPYLAFFIRQNFDPSLEALQGLSSYALICVAAASIGIVIARLHQTVWRYVSLVDALRIIAAISLILVGAVATSFVFTRLEGVPRSLPAIQWLLLIAIMIGTRIGFRLWHERSSHGNKQPGKPERPIEHILIVGVNDLTDLYLRSVAEFASADITVVGILSRERALQRRLMRQHKILGAPKDIQQVLAQLEVHGVTVDRIAVMQSFEQLSRDAQQALLEVERSSAIKVDWLVESLGFRQGHASGSRDTHKAISPLVVQGNEPAPRGYHHRVKRAIDLFAATCLLVGLAPTMAIIALLVAIDVGLPVVFWQQRPGRNGRPFRLFKLRTMRAAHDAGGNRVPDQLRCSKIGHFLRRTRLDEMPQLYNILVGEMSFVGPRPLLPIDQPENKDLRLVVRPGLTGWAQVNGGRDISPEDKAVLDVWYIRHASFWLDIKILLRTVIGMVLGDRASGEVVRAARTGLEKMDGGLAAQSAPSLGASLTVLPASAAQKAL
jgi:lipopolysaccharide/colanic/teichoic acid biosynthesis glycosyltransferase